MAEGAIPLAGGTLLVPVIARCERLEQSFVDISRLTELSQIETQSLYLGLGSMVTLDRLAGTKLEPGLRGLAQAAAAVGNPQVRRAATIGGNIAAGIPGADMIPMLQALNAEVLSLCGTKDAVQSIEDFSATQRLITFIRIPTRGGLTSAFRKLAWRRASGSTIASVAVALHVKNGIISLARVVVGGISAHPSRLPQTEQILTGHSSTIGAREMDELAEAAAAEANCDLQEPPSPEYRRRVIERGVREALTEAIQL